MNLEDNLLIDSEHDGYLEWVSGLIFVNRTLAEWEEFVKGPDDPFDYDRAQLKRTIVHETFHFYQVVTTGYLYRHVSQLFALLKEFLGQGAAREERVRALDEGRPIPIPSRFNDVLAALDIPGADGLTVGSIIESAAYLYEFRATYPEFGPRAYIEQLSIDDPPREYRLAYDLAHAALGNAAFDALLPIALTALSFQEPVEAFATAVESLARGVVARDPLETLEAIQRLAAAVACNVPPLGSAAEVASRPNGEVGRHPIYLDAVMELNRGTAGVEPLLVMIDPRRMLASFDNLMRPLCLRERAIWLPSSHRGPRDAAAIKQRLQDQYILATVSRHLQHRSLL